MSRGVGVNVGLSFHVETNLFGDLPAVTATLPMLWYEGKERPPAAGMRVMAFYARGYAIEIWDHAPDGFGWEKPPEDPGAPPAVLMDNGSSIRILDAPELEKAYIATVGEYLRLLRREKRDPGKYYEFLRPLAKSPVWRIRQDAREDLLKLLGPNGPGNFDLERLLDDPELMDIFKDYIRYVAIPARERRRAEAQKQQ